MRCVDVAGSGHHFHSSDTNVNISDPRFKYVPAVNTDVSKTLRAHGFKPTTQAERDARQKRAQQPPANVRNITEKKRRPA